MKCIEVTFTSEVIIEDGDKDVNASIILEKLSSRLEEIFSFDFDVNNVQNKKTVELVIKKITVEDYDAPKQG